LSLVILQTFIPGTLVIFFRRLWTRDFAQSPYTLNFSGFFAELKLVKTSEKDIQNFALAAVMIGIGLYIAVDSGVIDWTKKSLFRKNAATDQTRDPQESLNAYSQKLKQEIQTVEAGIQKEKQSLGSLQKTVVQYEKRIREQKKNLSQLDSEIKKLSDMKDTLTKVRARIGLQKNQKANLRENSGVADLRALMNDRSRAPSSVADLERRVAKVFAEDETTVAPVQYKSRDFLRLETKIKYDLEEGIYLTATGLRQVMVFAEGAMGLGYTSVALAHSGEDKQVLDRMAVIKSFIDERYGDGLAVNTVKVDEDMSLQDNFEIWMEKGGSQ
jgi:hypothetical protein